MILPARASWNGTPRLRVSDVTKAYAGVQALVGASLEVRPGEVHALVGENGAGKSTLIRILAGAVRADAGELALDGEIVAPDTPQAARALGVATIHQQPALFPALSVAENLALGLERPRWWSRVDWRARRQRARTLLSRVGATIDPDAEAGSLSMPEQQLVEIARALGADARLLILDEPTASLSAADARHLFGVLGELRARGVGMLFVSHRLDELAAVADRATVLRDGRTVGTWAMRELTREQLIRHMVGRAVAVDVPARRATPGAVALELRALGCAAGGVRDVTLDVRAGEIVGLAGLVGAGRTELARTIFGLTPADAGEIRLRGAPVRIDAPARAIDAGIGYLPEDRRRHGVVPGLSVCANVSLAALDRLSDGPLGALDRRRERALAAEHARRLGVRTPSIHTPVGELSGGNQQKVALSRWLVVRPAVLVLDEPTQGVDVGAKAEIHAVVRELAVQGIAILLISSDLPELLALSDRIGVMRAGTLVDMVDRDDATPERLLARALGAPMSGASPVATALPAGTLVTPTMDGPALGGAAWPRVARRLS